MAASHVFQMSKKTVPVKKMTSDFSFKKVDFSEAKGSDAVPVSMPLAKPDGESNVPEDMPLDPNEPPSAIRVSRAEQLPMSISERTSMQSSV